MTEGAGIKRQRGQHGPLPLSLATRRRMLARLLAKAEAGDVAAAEALVRLSITAKAADDSPARRDPPSAG